MKKRLHRTVGDIDYHIPVEISIIDGKLVAIVTEVIHELTWVHLFGEEMLDRSGSYLYMEDDKIDLTPDEEEQYWKIIA